MSPPGPDFAAERLAALRQLVPEAFTEGKVDFDELRTALGGDVDERPERYSFTWAGKRQAILELQKPTWGTLVPVRKDSVNFDTTQNLFIEGENLEVLKLLYKSYFGRVKLIYIDPPYNTGNDFVYPDNFADPKEAYLRVTGQKDAEGNLLTSNPESSGRYHSAWLSMMYPRLFLARQLLRDDGVIFVSIDDHEVHNLRLLMNEIFGEENHVETFIWKKSYGGGAKEKFAVQQHEYCLLFAKSFEVLSEFWLPPDPEAESKYYKFKDEQFEKRGPYRLKPLEATRSMDERKNLVFAIPGPDGKDILPKRQWWWGKERVMRTLAANGLVFTKTDGGYSVSYKQYLIDEDGDKRGAKPFSVIDGIYTQHGTDDLRQLFNDEVVMQFPKPVQLIQKLVQVNGRQDDLILDFFAGSATTAQAVLELNLQDGGRRNFVLVQLPETTDREDFKTIAEIAKERIRRVIARMNKKAEGELPLTHKELPADLGFAVFNLVLSTFKPWPGADKSKPEEYTRTMELFADPLVDGWKPESVIYEVALREGFSLTARLEKLPGIKGNTVWRVTDAVKGQSFRLCLDDELKPTTVRALALAKDDLFICRDVALDDKLAANLALQCRLKTI